MARFLPTGAQRAAGRRARCAARGRRRHRTAKIFEASKARPDMVAARHPGPRLSTLARTVAPCAVASVTTVLVPRYSVPSTIRRAGRTSSSKRTCSEAARRTAERARDMSSRTGGTAIRCRADQDRIVATCHAGLEGQEVHRRGADEIGDEDAGRTLVDLERWAELLDDAAVHDRDDVGHGHRFHLVVRHVHGGGLHPVVQGARLATAHHFAELGGERAERHVHEEGQRLPHDRAAQRCRCRSPLDSRDTGLSSRCVMRSVRAACSTWRPISARAMPCETSGKDDVAAHVRMCG